MERENSKENGFEKGIILRIRNRQIKKNLGHILRKNGIESLKLIWHNKVSRVRGNVVNVINVINVLMQMVVRTWTKNDGNEPIIHQR